LRSHRGCGAGTEPTRASEPRLGEGVTVTDVSRPRILLIKPVLPYPPDQGTKVVSFGLIKALGPRFDVTVLARLMSRGEAARARELEQWCARVFTVLAPSRKSIFHRAAYKAFYHVKSALLRRSLRSLYDCPGAFLEAGRALSKEHFDLVIIEYWQLYRMARFFPPDRCVLLTHDIDILVNRQLTLLERSLPRKIQALRRWIVERKEEITAYRGCRRVWTLTERDKAAVEEIQHDGREVSVLPIGIDTALFSPPGMKRAPGEVLFLGHLGASFNRDALEFFATMVYPKLAGVEGLSVTVVGGHLPDHLEFFGLRPDVEVVGHVSDVRPYLHRASCLVVPLRFGGGLRIRILEAMAAGVPVVCTSVAIAGMPFEPGTHFLLADDPDGLAEAIKRVLSDAEFAGSLAASALRRVREEYPVDAQESRAVELVTRVISGS
jgi:glycosyltransferase involved in cell wall biosynthesis